MEYVDGFRVTRSGENAAEIAALAESVATRTGLTALLDDLNRAARHGQAPGRAVHRALTWDEDDVWDESWWVQGITTSENTGSAPNLLLVGWYSRQGEGSRVTFLDLDRLRYRHVLLVEPVLDDGEPTVQPVRVHAGGLVWHGPYLHVTATARGFLTFRVEDLLWVPDDSPLRKHGYRYLLPLRLAHRADADDGLEKLRFSFMSLDRSTEPPCLVAGEYGRGDQTHRLARLPIDVDTGLPETGDDGISRPMVDAGGVGHAQGVCVVDGTYYVTSSRGRLTPSSVYVGSPGDLREHRWAGPMGIEDLVWWGEHDRFWSASEYPGRRWVFSMRRSWFSERSGPHAAWAASNEGVQ